MVESITLTRFTVVTNTPEALQEVRASIAQIGQILGVVSVTEFGERRFVPLSESMPSKRSLGKTVEAWRLYRDLNQGELARLMVPPVTHAIISDMERDHYLKPY